MTDTVNTTELTCRIQSIEIREVVKTPLGMKASLLWSANLSENSTADLHKARDYIAREIAMREAATPTNEPFHLETTQPPHEYTKADFERMGFDLEVANNALRDGELIVSETSAFPDFPYEGFPDFGERMLSVQLTDESRAALQEMVRQYRELHHG